MKLSVSISSMPQSACFMQILSINPSLIKLRMLREKPQTPIDLSSLLQTGILGNLEQRAQLLNMSQTSSQENQVCSTGQGSGSTGLAGRRQRAGFLPLAERLRQGMAQQITSQIYETNQSSMIETSTGNQSFKLLEGMKLVETEIIGTATGRRSVKTNLERSQKALATEGDESSFSLEESKRE
ncbi:hypothetical protein FGO68_gene7151 [Halteria grandinella]|uniref:Uncharacterized protein n=1 Tax=Halteria grandinella TaxID=5974 RepID=A0A8J8SV55_HALGN|nr:hypothetical protein FGO68_gene7151 [Halteria grandinella]